ncbi:unnamed protein product [Spirodela intermedia]|uniref:Uncharacterized protein n=1 Tax=Spirodela intermedia TaxID=51605 RepID=A0A7I8L1N6_SPIIN|nr:unnamed protein product [Spirodela intermedia]
MGTPAHTLSRVEFHPQWVRKPPTAGCDRITTCGAHPRIRNPLPLFLSSNPSSPSQLSNSREASSPRVLMAQINGCPEASRPKPTSTS